MSKTTSPERCPARERYRAAAGTLVAVLLTASCGVLSPEEQLLTAFFQAARLRDTTVLATFSDVDFNPRTRGVVRRFEVAQTARAIRDGREQVDLTVNADVRRPDGITATTTFHITLQRRDGRHWMIVALEPQANAP